MRTSLAIAALVASLSSGCGATIGDACTTAAECSGGLCNNRDYAPGGYCTIGCKANDSSSCPTGSVCVSEALGKDSPACFRLCFRQADCRNGYTCRSVKDSANICVGPVAF